MIEIPKNPREVGVEHDNWRPNQLSMLKKVVNSKQEFVFAELPTGSGKSAVATALGNFSHVMVCVHTLALLTQYEQNYGFTVIRGRQEYSCAHKDKIASWKAFHKAVPTAADCTYSPMHKCPYSEECDYILAKELAFASKRMACTYKYAALSYKAQMRRCVLVFDEAHDAVEEIIKFNKFEYAYKYLNFYKLPPFPITEYGEDNHGDIIDQKAQKIITQWIIKCVNILSAGKHGNTEKQSKKKKLHDTLDRLVTSLNDGNWYLKVTPKHFIIQALQADRVAEKIFNNKDQKLLMSATIGNPEPLADGLGIKEYDWFTFDHPIPISKRSVDILQVPRMIHRNLSKDPSIYKLQVEKVWEWISMFDPEWRGIILSTSYYKIKEFYTHLKRYTSDRRLIVQESGMKVGDVVGRFISDVLPGDIMIGTVQGMGTGIDLYGELARWAVIAGVPHVNPTDHYMKTRRKIMGGIRYQHWITYNAVTQAAGRISRGTRNGNGSYLANYVAIADGSAVTNTAMKYYPGWFKEAIA